MMQAFKLYRYRALCYRAVRMYSKQARHELFLKPRIKDLDTRNLLLEISKPKTRRDPMVAGLAVSDYFDERLLTYPEVLDAVRLRSIENVHDEVKSYVDSLDPNVLKTEFPPEVREKLKSFGAFGALIPKEHGGQGWTTTEFVRFIEAFANNLSLATIVIAHNCAASLPILHYGSKELKSKYLPKLATGEFIGAFAYTEEKCGSDFSAYKTTVRKLTGGDHMLLNGEKIFVTNGLFANLFTTACSLTPCSEDVGDGEAECAVLLVERDLPGVKVNKAPALRGLQGNGLASVTFEDVRLSNSQLLGATGYGVQIIPEMQRSLQLLKCAAGLAAFKSIYNSVIPDVHVKKHKLKILDQDLGMQEKLADMAIDIYLAESAIYLNAALEDSTENKDSLTEIGTTAIHCFRFAAKAAEDIREFYGSEAFEEGRRINAALRDLDCLEWFYQTGNLLMLLVSMTAVKMSGAAISEKVKILRDPLTYFPEWRKLFLKSITLNDANRNRPSHLEPAVHPSLKREANVTAFHHRRMQLFIQNCFKIYGSQILEHQRALMNMTTVIVETYMLTVALARLNRSVTRDFETADFERILFKEAEIRTSARLDEIHEMDGTLLTGTVAELERDVFDKLLIDGKYTFEHPLLKNF